MSDVLRELEEDLRREQLDKFWRAYGSKIIGTIVFLLLIGAALGGYQSWQNKQNSLLTTELSTAIQQSRGIDSAAAQASLTALLAKTGKSQSMLAAFSKAGLLLQNADHAGAIAVYEQIRDNKAYGNVYRDLAELLAIQAQMDAAIAKNDVAPLRKRLQPLIAAGASFQATALELEAVLAEAAGDLAAANAALETALGLKNTPDATRLRLQDYQRLLQN